MDERSRSRLSKPRGVTRLHYLTGLLTHKTHKRDRDINFIGHNMIHYTPIKVKNIKDTKQSNKKNNQNSNNKRQDYNMK